MTDVRLKVQVAGREDAQHGRIDLLVGLVVPILLVIGFLCQRRPSLLEMAGCFALVYFGIGVPMSVCMHRYFSHGAFRCSRWMQFLLGAIGCLANQGGPLWWAGKHRRHHALCDKEGDPHSAVRDGTAYAWMGWTMAAKEFHPDLDWVPKRMQTPEMLVLDSLWFVPPALVFFATAHTYSWHAAVLYVSTPMLLCRLATLWFNVEFHPAEIAVPKEQPISSVIHEAAQGLGLLGLCLGGSFGGWRGALIGCLLCTAIDAYNNRRAYAAYVASGGKSSVHQCKRPCLGVDMVNYLAGIVGENCHADHHTHPARACRPSDPVDAPYYLFLKPLHQLGLVWQLKGCEAKPD